MQINAWWLVAAVCGGAWFGYFVACLMHAAARRRPRGWQPAGGQDGPICPPPPARRFFTGQVKEPPAPPMVPPAPPARAVRPTVRTVTDPPLVRMGQGSYTIDYTPGRPAAAACGQILDAQA